jgi:hypothetical protein
MRKYRILECFDGFFPQEKKWFKWKYIDNFLINRVDSKKHLESHKCKDLGTAKWVIELRINFLNKMDNVIIHKYEQDNGK